MIEVENVLMCVRKGEETVPSNYGVCGTCGTEVAYSIRTQMDPLPKLVCSRCVSPGRGDIIAVTMATLREVSDTTGQPMDELIEWSERCGLTVVEDA